MNIMKRWILSLAAVFVLVVVAYQFIDRPLAVWSHENLHAYPIFGRLTLLTEYFPPIAVVAICLLGLLSLSGRALSRPREALLLCCISLVVARATKDQLKLVFGRTWPETWTNNNPSLIHDGVFGFNPFRHGAAFESFPSGHMIGICAVVTAAWLYYPRLGLLYTPPVLVVATGLIGANYHFLSDIIAGCFTGGSVALFCVSLWKGIKGARSKTGGL